MRRGLAIAEGVPSLTVDLDQDSAGRVLVDIDADVSQTPHAATIAALLIDRAGGPGLADPAVIRSALMGSAHDICNGAES